MPIASPEYNLQVLYPDVAKQWHPTKNEGTKPQDFTPHSAKKPGGYVTKATSGMQLSLVRQTVADALTALGKNWFDSNTRNQISILSITCRTS